MIKIRFSGGLGNQLYQLGFLWYLQDNGFAVRPDFCEYTYYAFHQGLELNKILRIPYDDEIRNVERSRHQWYKVFDEKLGFWLRFHYHKFVAENFSEYIEEEEGRIFDFHTLRNKNEVTLKGHWQKLDYLLPIQGKFHECLHYCCLNTERDKRIKTRIEDEMSVSIHVRRGDYLKEMQYQVIKDFKYYDRAIRLLKEKHPNASFFVFSDDIEWVKNQIHEDNVTFVDWNKGQESYKDMLLMSLCKHNIIANSTFSWWGAFLNSNMDKIVVCPDEWLVGESAIGHVPENWTKISAV